MKGIMKAQYKSLSMPAHRIKTIGGVGYLTCEGQALKGERIMTTERVGAFRKGSILEVKNAGQLGVKAAGLTDDPTRQMPLPIEHGKYKVLREISEPRPLSITTYGKQLASMIEYDGTPTFNPGYYDHTVIDLTSIEQDKGHTLVLKLPGGAAITVCPIFNGGITMVDIAPHNVTHEMLTFEGNRAPIRSSASLFCLELNREKGISHDNVSEM